MLFVKPYVVGHIALPYRQLLLNDGMAALMYFQHVGSVDNRTYVVIFLGRLSKAQQAVEPCHQVGINLYGRNILLHGHYQLAKQAGFQRENLFFGSQNLLLVFFQLLRNIAFGLCQRLFANPVVRYFVFIRITHLQIVAKHIVVTYFQRGDARLLGLAFLNLHQILLAMFRNVAQLIELGIASTSDNVTFVHQLWRVVFHLTANAVAQALAKIDLLPHPMQHSILRLQTGFLHRHQSLQCYP